MENGLLLRFNSILTTGKERSVRIKKNILASFFIKGAGILTNLMLVPLTINYMNPVKYGIWITLFSVISWLSFFDAGLGNGLRNKLAEALAEHDHEKARIYVSTTYAILSLIVTCVFILFMSVNPLLSWSHLLNAPQSLEHELKLLAAIVTAFFCMRFVLQLIGIILSADQKPAYNNLFNLGSNLISLAAVYLLTRVSSGSLLYPGIAISLAPVIIYIIASYKLFKGGYKQYRPSFKFIDLRYSKELMNLGFRFFIIQISAVILFTTDNLIITHMFGPAEVTSYNIAYRYFSTFIMIFTIIAIPFWSAFTEAYVKKDFQWIQNAINKLVRLWMAISVLIIAAIMAAPLFYKLWIGESVDIPFTLSLNMGLYAIIYTWTYIFVTFLNGIGKISFQFFSSIAVALLNIPLSILLAGPLGLSSSGVILATSICVGLGAVWSPVQYFKVLSGKANGVWAR